MNKLGVYCAGGFGGVVMELANELNHLRQQWEQIVFIDDASSIGGHKAPSYSLETFRTLYSPDDAEIVVAAGEPRIRETLFHRVREYGYRLPNLVHPKAEVKPDQKMGEGNIILAYSYLSKSGVTIGDNNIIMPYAQISHDNVICSHCVIASSATLSGTTTIGDRAYIGVGAKLREHITVGRDAIVGMGAIVTKNVCEESVVMGIPAKETRKNTGKVF